MCLHGDGSVWDRNGSKNWTCFFGGPVFGPDRERIDSKQKAYPSRFLDRNHLEPVLCEHSLRCGPQFSPSNALCTLFNVTYGSCLTSSGSIGMMVHSAKMNG